MKTTVTGFASLLCTLVLQLFFYSLPAQAPGWAWARSAGSGGRDWSGTTDYHSSTLATDPQGNSYMTGLFEGAATFGTVSILGSASYPSMFVAKYDINGNCIWVRQLAGTLPDAYGNQGFAVSLDGAGNCYVAGIICGPPGNTIPFGVSTLTTMGHRQIIIAKYDPNGNEQWARQASTPATTPSANPGGSNDYAYSIAADQAGNSVITGWLAPNTHNFGSVTLLGAGSYAAKYDASGNLLWATKIGDTGPWAESIALDPAGNSFISGYLQQTTVYQTVPATTLVAVGYRDVFLAKVSPGGTLLWVKQFPSVAAAMPPGGESYGHGVSTDAQGNVF